MALRDEIPEMLDHIKSNQAYLSHNYALFDIYEGNLLPYIEKDLAAQLSAQSYLQAQYRIPPINILRRIVDKLSKIYQQSPIRTVEDGSEQDTQLVSWYENELMLNAKMNISNEFFNLFKTSLVEPFVYKSKPHVRIIPSDRFLVISKNPILDSQPTHIITVAGSYLGKSNQKKIIYHAYTDYEFVIFNSDGDVLADKMNALNNLDGINPYGKLPFIYINRSLNCIQPKIDTDTLRMTKLIPLLLADLNYAVMFQAFSVLYTIDADSENLQMSPNVVWNFKSDPTKESKPQVGSIKPQVEIEPTLNLIQSQFAFWLNSKGIKPGAVGQITAENFSSGISKIIDEMDTAEDRQKQAQIFKAAEENDFWDLLLNHMHPIWSQAGLIDNSTKFTPSAKVKVNFAEQLPMTSRGQIVRDLKDEVAAGFISRERAIKKLNPDLNAAQIEELISEIEDSGADAPQEPNQEMVQEQSLIKEMIEQPEEK